MTLDQLRIFIAVAEREHVTHAAEALNLTQSAASGAIAALESRHGVKLFDRMGRNIRLTDAGRLFLNEARAVVGRADGAQQVLAEIGGVERGTLTLVASQTIASYWLPPRLARYRRHHPGIDIDLAIGNTREAAAMVRDGGADLGFVEGLIDDPAVARWPVGDDRLVLVASQVPTGPVDDGWLRTASWILREPGSGTRSTFETAMAARGIAPDTLDTALVLPSNEAVRTAVESGAGVAMLSALVVAPALAAGRLHALPVADIARPFFGLRHKERYRSSAADALLAIVSDSAS